MEFAVSKEDVSALVLEYFKITGLKYAHDAFIKEARITEEKESSYLSERHGITQHVLAGEIRQAVSKLSDVDATLLRSIGFHLQKQALLEIIKKGDSMPEALKYAQVQVAPLAKDNPQFVSELENIMALLLYSNLSNSPDAHYLSDDQRRKTAEIANSTLLRYAKYSEKSKLERLMKAIFWAQDIAQAQGIAVPKLIDLRTLSFDTSPSDSEAWLMDEDATVAALDASEGLDEYPDDEDLLENHDDDEEEVEEEDYEDDNQEEDEDAEE